MTQIQAFCELCAILLAAACACALIIELVESREYRYPTWKVGCCEAPIVLYIILLSAFLLPPKLSWLHVLGVVSSYLALVQAFMLRLRIYNTRREAREHARLLAVSAEVSKKVEGVKVRVMDLMERERLLKAIRPKSKSRYERDPVI